MQSEMDQFDFTNYLTHSSVSQQPQNRRLEQKDKMIEFYQQEKQRRMILHQVEREEKARALSKTVENLKFLIEVEREREQELLRRLSALKDRGSLSSIRSAEEASFSLRFSTDTIISNE